MLKNSFVQVIAVLCVFVQSVDAQYRVGDRVIVISQAGINSGGIYQQFLGRGQDVRIDGVYYDQLQVKNVKSGMISQSQVATPSVALGIFSDQIAANPSDAGAYYARGITRENLNQYDLAIADFNEAIRLDPSQSCGFIGRGNCWANTGDAANAIKDYTEAIRLKPESTIAFANRARMWNATGEYAKAIADANEAIRIAPSYVSAYSARAVAFAATKQFADATADCERIAAISSPGISGYNDVAWSLAMSPDTSIRNGKKAVEFATKASTLTNGRDGAVLDTLAVACAESSDFNQAVTWEKKAIAVSSDRDRSNFEDHLKLFQASQTLLDGKLASNGNRASASNHDSGRNVVRREVNQVVVDKEPRP